MTKHKNKVTLIIEDCRQCPSATRKPNQETKQENMFCQTRTHCIQLRESWEPCPIPGWCPRLKH